jgi:hypothetical protein
MRGFVPPDPETRVSEVRFAVITTPHTNRTRYAAACVEIMTDESSARAAAVAGKTFAARVLGPSKSSEGQYIYYLMEWL